MVEQHAQDKQIQLVLAPNKSMSWDTNKKILIVLFCLNMSIALMWTYMGAWLVLPFAGLEVFFVGLGMYYVSWKLNFKHIITLEGDSLILQKGVYFPKQEWQWQRSQTSLIKTPSKYRLSPPQLQLQHQNQRVEIGEFLNRSEKKTLQSMLGKLDIPVVAARPK